MSEEQHQFMRLLGQMPARLTAEQAAWVLNCQPHDIPTLVAVRLLRPLGNPPPSSVKFFAASEVLEQAKDRTWLAKVTNALNQHWQKKNAAKKKCPADDLPNDRIMANGADSIWRTEPIVMSGIIRPLWIVEI